MRAYKRLLQYVTVSTQSSETSGTTPSTACQWTLAHQLVEEMTRLGLDHPSVDANCIVTAWLPATAGYEEAPAIGFLAHMDTAPAFSGDGVTPIVHPNYDGEDIVLPKDGRVIKKAEFPFLADWKGHTVITADGSTLLGADDKAGVAEIMTLCERLQQTGEPHGKLCIAFTPDEEIGEGPDHFDVASFGARYAYTVDGGEAGSIEYENFNAASATVHITGVSVHPGSAKGIMENALLLAGEINALLPPDAIPGKTEGYDGFYHLERLDGNAAEATMEYILRDHDHDRFETKKETMRRITAQIAACHPTAKIELTLRDSYYNMAQQLTGCMHLVENAKKAAVRVGITPTVMPIRGGTDGARLSYMGLPCPNLGTGGANFHGPYEIASAESMDAVVDILQELVRIYAEQR